MPDAHFQIEKEDALCPILNMPCDWSKPNPSSLKTKIAPSDISRERSFQFFGLVTSQKVTLTTGNGNAFLPDATIVKV